MTDKTGLEWKYREPEETRVRHTDDVLVKAREAFAKRRAEAIEDRIARVLGTGKDVALWERYEYDLPSPKIHLAFREIDGGSTPSASPCGFESSVCTVFRTSAVKVGKA